MGLFDQLFGKSAAPAAGAPAVRFGRYNDTAKSPAQYAAWERALDLFAEKKYLDAQEALLVFLADAEEKNVEWTRHAGYLDFRLYQGSELISGRMDAERITATARIAEIATLQTSFLRRLLEKNYQLEYARFALEDRRYLVMRFDSHAVDGSPHKLYAGLRELATQADKMDDLLLEEFSGLAGADDSHLTPLPEKEKEVKYAFLQREIRRTLDLLATDDLHPELHPGGAAYLLLALCYKLDYLLKPEGGTMDTLERVHRMYLTQDDLPLPEKIDRLRTQFVRLRDRSRAELFREMYVVRATFGITTALNHDAFAQLLRAELDGMDWYAENDLTAIAAAIPTYLVGHTLFSYALPPPDRDLLHLYFHITENAYFRELGFPQRFFTAATQKFYPKAIRKAIQQLTARHRSAFGRFSPDTSRLQFSDPLAFRKSYLEMVMGVDLG